jgi:hypothetical protein
VSLHRNRSNRRRDRSHHRSSRNRSRRSETVSVSGGFDTNLPEQRSRRRDDGSGQAARKFVTSITLTRLDRPHPLKPHQVVACAPTPDRNTTPAKGISRREGLTHTGPVTEACVLPRPQYRFLRGSAPLRHGRLQQWRSHSATSRYRFQRKLRYDVPRLALPV